MSRDEIRDTCNDQLVFFCQKLRHFFPKGEYATDFKIFLAAANVLFQYDLSLCIKFCLNYLLFLKNFKSLGGLPIHDEIFDRVVRGEEWGAFLMTEVGHGSNVQGVMTTATYEPETQEFVLNTPNDLAAKFWIGNLAKTATFGVAVAQLICQGRNQGVHLFAVPLRDRVTHNIYPGLIIGDCGPKIGMHGIDNGMCWF